MHRRTRFILAAIPFIALSVAVPFVNRVEPRIAGLPFILAWIAFWVLVTPAFVWQIGRVERRW
ncbi:MAG TPA: DUF3311 domain-containing protein [Candidatus Baltobacteraceae bacterium]|nr:DUF3311 domain-containing protein [Candidatus Baltobacteraceae bacterium]